MYLVLTVLSAVLVADVTPAPIPKELQQLQGKWVLSQGEKNGTKVEKQEQDNLVLEIREHKWIFTGQEKATITAIDSKIIDLKSCEQGRVGRVDEGIYKLEGDRLTFCVYQGDGKKRPTEFTSTDDDTVLVVFERLKR